MKSTAGIRIAASIWVAATVAVLSACGSSPLPTESKAGDASGTPPPYDAGEPAHMDGGNDATVPHTPPSQADAGTACLTSAASLVPATTTNPGGAFPLACGAWFSGNDTLVTCFCPNGAASCPDEPNGVPGAWNSTPGCGFCMAPNSTLCGATLGTPYSCSNAGTCIPSDCSVGGFACCPAGQKCTSWCGAVCTPGATRCANNAAETCGYDGKWGKSTTCTGQACVDGGCTGVCVPGLANCSDGGVATCTSNGQWDVSPCVGSYCDQGACVSNCEAGTAVCVGNSAQTCGPNGTWGAPAACNSQACVDGGCSGVCTPGTVSCIGSAPGHCNLLGEWDAGMNCPSPTTECAAGSCICPDAGTACGGSCVDVNVDPKNCGMCGNTCSATGESCDAGSCACAAGSVVCDGGCLNVQSDVNNCGACGVTCTAVGEGCDAGVCGCAAGSLVCNGSCLDVQADPNNCGACGVACSGTCGGGRCLTTLASGRSGPNGIAADEMYVYWADTDGGTVTQALHDGGSVTTIASGQGGPTSIAAGQGIFWSNTASGEIVEGSAGGGWTQTIASNQSLPGTIALVYPNVFWTTSATPGGASAIQMTATNQVPYVVTQWASDYGALGLTAFASYFDGTVIFWSDAFGVNAKGTVGTLNANQDLGSCQPPCPIAANGTTNDAVVWANSGSANAVVASSITGSTHSWVVATGPTNQTRVAIAQDGVNAYWANSDGTIMKAPITPGTAVTLASGQGTPRGLAIDSTSVYWTDSSAGTVMRLTPR